MSEPVQLTVAVLDYLKPQETRLCLESIKLHLRVTHKTVLLDNGGQSEYAWQLYRSGLCDTLISKRESLGGGVGQTDLFRWSDTQYTMFVQQDQYLTSVIDIPIFESMTKMLQEGYRCIDLNGDQSGRRVWTDRAHLVETSFFNSLAPFPNGGPGPLHELRWNENYLQEVFSKPENQIFHIPLPFFRDNGVWTVRTQQDGSRVRMKTDTKEVHWEILPTKPYVFPDMSETEWKTSIEGKWVNGTVPERYIQHSFRHWT